MELLQVLLAQLFDKEQAGETTMSVSISMVSSTHCSHISRLSTCDGDETRINFKPPLPIEEAVLHARKYEAKGCFTHA